MILSGVSMDQTGVQRGVNRKPQVRRSRRDGWTAERQSVFFGHLCATCNVKLSAAKAGVGLNSAYEKRRADPVFAERWRQALADGYVRLETMLIARAGGTGDAEALARAVEAEAAGDAGALRELTETLDTELALQLLSFYRKVVNGGARKVAGPRRGKATMEQVEAAILKQLSVLNRRRGGPG